MPGRHRFDPLPSRKLLVVLVASLALVAGCSPAVTPPGPNIAYGQVDRTGYTLLRWQAGLDILVWTDQAGSSSCQGSGSTADRVYRLRCQAESPARRVEWEAQTGDGKTAQFSIDGKTYDLGEGRLFLIRTGAGETRVVQLQRDLSAARVEDRESIEAFARADPDVSGLIGKQ